MIRARWALVALLGALPFPGCGGKALTAAPPLAGVQDAATDAPSEPDQQAPDGSSDASPLDATSEPEVDAGQDVADASQDAAEEPDAAAEAGIDAATDADAGWDHTCWCKNWDDQRYPYDFFSQWSCVNGMNTCPAGYVCCALTCVSPAVCVNTVDGWNNTMPPPAPQPPPDDCSHYFSFFPQCIPADECAPDGVLTRRDYDQTVDYFPMCTYPGYTPPP